MRKTHDDSRIFGPCTDGRAHLSGPHAHGHHLDRQALCRRERFQQIHRSFELSHRHQVQYPRAVYVS
jgi:hypothetical protein